MAGVAGSAVGAVGGALLMLVTGLYLAANPELYRRGALRLLPTRLRGRVDRSLCAAGNGLSRWLLGQAFAMVLVGAMTAIGLAAIGMPVALPLGLIAGILGFVPFFGAIVAGALTVLLAFTQGAGAACTSGVRIRPALRGLWSAFVRRWAIALPPALGLISVLVFGLLFGGLGALLAVPLMVVLMILVQQLYLDSLEACGINPRQHDVRFEEDNWESPTLGAWGTGWQVLFDGLEISQFTYFQQAGGVELAPISAERTYGLERIAMSLQRVSPDPRASTRRARE